MITGSKCGACRSKLDLSPVRSVLKVCSSSTKCTSSSLSDWSLRLLKSSQWASNSCDDFHISSLTAWHYSTGSRAPYVWLQMWQSRNSRRRGVLTTETSGRSSLPVYHIKMLQRRKVMLSGWGSEWGMWAVNATVSREGNISKGGRETSPWFPTGCRYILSRSGVKAPRAILGKCFSQSLSSPSLCLSSFRGCLGFGSFLYLPLLDWDSIRCWHGVKNKVVFLPFVWDIFV